jgi:putative FmdB family regulatory protein
MPTYKYRCYACGYEFEQFQKITDDPISTCPQCRAEETRRIITGGAGFVLKGSGFYTTDYRSESYKEGRKKDEAASQSEVASPKKDDKKTASTNAA